MKSEQFLASLLSGQYINTIKQAEQWGFPTPFLSRPISKAVAEIPSDAFVHPGLRSLPPRCTSVKPQG